MSDAARDLRHDIALLRTILATLSDRLARLR
jgi:hypothetical protein